MMKKIRNVSRMSEMFKHLLILIYRTTYENQSGYPLAE